MERLALMPKYEAYKNSNTDWLNEIPEQWEIKKVFHLFTAKKGRDAAMLTKEYIGANEGPYPVYSGQTENEGVIGTINRFEFDYSTSGCMFSTTVGAKAMTVKYLKSKFSLSQNCMIIVPRKIRGNELRYFYYAFQPMFQFYRNQIPDHMQASFRMEDLYQFRTLVPSLEEQTRIANFLDKKTAQIDDAIAIKEQQISLLKERKQIIIQQAVTQGLDPNVPMKDSGVDWIGKVPAHWEVRRSKFVFTQRKERAWKDDVQLSATQAYGVIPQDQYEELTGKRVVKIQFHLDKRKHVEKDDFVISMRSFQGGLERAWSQGCIRSSYVVLRPVEEIDPSFYGYLLKLPSYIAALQQTASFIRDGQDLNFDNFSKVDLFIPPIEEQKEIANYVSAFMKSSDEGIELLLAQIEKLKEYKTTLINSTVTGKIKITPEMVEQ